MSSALSVCDKSRPSHISVILWQRIVKGTKSHSTYNWFFSDAIWDENEVTFSAVRISLFFMKPSSFCCEEMKTIG